MKRIAILLALLFTGAVLLNAQAAAEIEPNGTYLFAQRDSCDLYLDIYDPSEGSVTEIDGKKKPTIVFVFGGGFISGERDNPYYKQWFRRLIDDGYRVASIDYRLGLKGVKNVGIRNLSAIYNAIEIGVEDLYSATTYLCDNAEALGIDPSGIVICGSSAGAIICMQAEWHLCNGEKIASTLPEGFRYSGVISYSGAVFSRSGKPSYKKEPAPTLFFHGTADKIVKYGRIWFFRNRFGGAGYLSKIFKKKSYNYNIYRFNDAGHEIAGAFMQTYEEMTRFIESNVVAGQKRIVDSIVDDPILPKSRFKTLGDLYD